MYPLQQWQQHALVELGGVFTGIFEYDSPGELAARLDGIARDLRQYFLDDALARAVAESSKEEMSCER